MDNLEHWQKRFQEWRNKTGLKKDASPLEVFRSLMETADRESRGLVSDLEKRFDHINEILEETWRERKNR